MNHLSARKHHNALDENSKKVEKQHMKAIQEAKLRHDNVRCAAEAAQAEHDLREARRARKEQVRQERKRQDAIEAKRRLLAEEEMRHRQQLEEADRLEAEADTVRARQDEERRAHEQMRRERQREREAAARLAEEERKTAEEHAQKERQVNSAHPAQALSQSVPASTDPASTTPAAPPGNISTAQSDSALNIHQQYLALHTKLKEMRKFMEQAKQQSPSLKAGMGEMRRQLRSEFSKFTTDPAKNKPYVERMRTACYLFEPAFVDIKDRQTGRVTKQQIESPMLDVRNFIVRPIPATVDQSDCQVPGLRIYLLNIFAKAIVKQIMSAGPNSQVIQPLGLAANVVLADSKVTWQGLPLSDFVLAKLHKTIPVLFGIKGNEQTEQGRAILGWAREGGTKKGPWAKQQTAAEQWLNLGAGLAALSLRAFPTRLNISVVPFPPQIYWECMARLLNTPPDERYQAHYTIVQGMIEYSAPNLIKIFGQMGKALIRTALVSYPTGSEVRGADYLTMLRTLLERNHGIYL